MNENVSKAKTATKQRTKKTRNFKRGSIKKEEKYANAPTHSEKTEQVTERVNRLFVGEQKRQRTPKKIQIKISNDLWRWVFNIYRVFALFSKQFEQFRLATAHKDPHTEPR